MISKTIEGVIKFKFNLKPSSNLDEKSFLSIEKWRAIFFKMNLVGECPTDKVGFGNLSQRSSTKSSEFIITGTQTGKLPYLNGSHYTKVVYCDPVKMTIDAVGPIGPSSESITHHSIYSNSDDIHAVFHIHHHKLWSYILENDYPSTPLNVEYGTKEMAQEVRKCIKSKSEGVFAMEGHQGGIIAYGSSTENAGKIILEILKESKI